MKSARTSSSHMGAEAVLDYLDGRLDAGSRQAVEEHLALPCARCRELVRELGWTLERMRLDRVPEVPLELRARALAVFQAEERPSVLERATTALARLVFDSLRQPLPALARRAVGEARRLHFALGSHSLELEVEVESAAGRALRGRLQSPEPALHWIEIAVGSERWSLSPDTNGSFALDRVPSGRARIEVKGPSGRYRLPAFDL